MGRRCCAVAANRLAAVVVEAILGVADIDRVRRDEDEEE
jgi:hypothetical protein